MVVKLIICYKKAAGGIVEKLGLEQGCQGISIHHLHMPMYLASLARNLELSL
jgi:hypothetical protein